MGNNHHRMRGFTLIASLLVMVLLSGIAIGLLFLVNSQQHVGSNDMEDNLAFYGAESGMEKLTADISNLYAGVQNPNAGQISALGATSPAGLSGIVGSINYTEKVWQPTDNTGAIIPPGNNIISSGPEAGLHAETIPISMQVQATTPSGASVNMYRTVEVALIPVFQFGVFCDSDCSYFAGPQFDFAGRIHTNGNLFLASGSNLFINDKVTAFGEIILDRLANDHLTSAGYTGNVYLANAPNGCTGDVASGTCLPLTTADASWINGIPPAGTGNSDASYSTWTTNSAPFNTYALNGFSGAKKLSLPFVQVSTGLPASPQQIQILRKGLPTDSASLSSSKLWYKAAIRILLADTEAELVKGENPPVAPGDANDIDLTGGGAANGLQITTPAGLTRVAMAKAAVDPGWTAAPNTAGKTIANPATPNWNLVNGWIRVEYLNLAGTWTGVTKEWLGYGFARGTADPTAPLSNTVHPDAILILQEARPGVSPTLYFDTGAGNFRSEFSWYPINFWDPREGLTRDTNGALSATDCTANGVMNAVELDVGNLNLWLKGAAPYGGASGIQVNSTVQNGYVLYFSDRRGMQVDSNVVPPAINGEYGFEDVINVDGGLEPITPGYNVDSNITPPKAYSPEDSDENGVPDNWGAINVGDGFLTPSTAANPYQKLPTSCAARGAQNIVTGARHVLKLIDGSLNNVPMAPPAPPTNKPSGGFTVASENPVYIQGDYNSNVGDPVWGGGDVPHAAASIIADSVSLLSSGWTDQNSLAFPIATNGSTGLNKRPASKTYYRVAIAGGKSMNFPQPAGTGQDFGTDGGVHNFLRLLEDWNPGSGQVSLYYRGSLVSLYYSQYATGTFKCCTEVYDAPVRKFSFDTDFLVPANLPPGTPMLQDINNLSERQDFTPQ